MAVRDVTDDLPEWKQHWTQFVHTLGLRLDLGHQAYGDESFRRAADSLAGELAEEALDIVGWGFILWCRIKELEAKAKELEASTK